MSDSGSEAYGDSASDFSDGGPTPPSTSRPESKTKAPKSGSNASAQYQKLSQLEHVLKRPDTYIGSVEKTAVEMWVFDAATESMVHKEVHIVPGLYKIFDEILVNAADNKIRDPSMKNIKVKIDPDTNMISVMNDGKGIPIEIHDKEKMYIPEMIFGNLLTSSNYDDEEKKVTGGRNGFGAKLCNIFSTQFELETADLNTEQLYKQIWNDNMAKVSKPKITKLKTKKEYTKVTFKPDLAKFGMESLDDEILSVLRRRVYDLCGTVKGCNIYLNDKKLNIKNFKGYVEMYVNAIKERNPEPVSAEPKNYTTLVHEVVNERWEIAFAVSDGSFNQVSFVNSIATTSGGTHVKFVSDQIISKLVETLTKKQSGKKKLMIKPQEVRNNMCLFVNCLIDNPAFTSQTKEQLTTRAAQFGGKPSEKLVISDQFIAKILKTSIVDKINDIASANEDKALQKVDGGRHSRIKNQVKLVDANKAGTKDGYKCTLILTEGDSAKSLAVAGMAVVGRNYYGCFPLRGKLLNVREASTDQIAKNAEINALKQIIGLQHKKHYDVNNVKNLRYGHLMIMTDQDHDGSHIKGLIINFLETSFPGLLSIPGFLLEFITPIVKITIKERGSKRVIPFYNMPEFEEWRATEGTRCRWKHKYYKGLGTSSAAEAREYFQALDRHLKTFHTLQDDDKQYIDLAFAKNKADDRKEWLQGYAPGTHLDPSLNEIPISDFINKELILFSMADNIRSIPSVLDGFKPGQRKVLYGCFKRNLKSEVKVAQLAGYVSENTGYHHGETNLIPTIIGLAQNFVGSNNLNILKPNGAFGTRAAGGKDYSAARYIFTELNEITRKVFNPLDNPLYTYMQDDESTVEPEWYLPVLPMILVNGADGIGTGWSTNIPCYNPVDLVKNIRKMMAGEELEEMMPWYRGWDGDLEKLGPDKFRVSGRINLLDETSLEITEIPVKMWTDNVKSYLLSCLSGDKGPAWIKDMEEHHGANINFWVKLTVEEMAKTERIGFLERFKLISSISLTNMVAFDPSGRIKRYASPLDILRDYYYVRLEYYQKRKDHMMEDLQNQLTRLSEQARFIKMIIDKKLTVSNRKRKELVEVLQQHDFVMFNKDGTQVKKANAPSLFLEEAEEQMQEEEEEIGDISQLNIPGSTGSAIDEGEHKPDSIYSLYDYLLGMAIWSLTRERYEKLLKQKGDREDELNILLGKSAKDLWNEDLDDFMIEWEKFLERDLHERSSMVVSNNTKKRARKPAVKKEPKKDKEPPAKKAKTVVKKEKPTSTETKSSSHTPELKQEPDVLSFFKKGPSKASNTASGSKDAPVSLFSESDDDDILGNFSSTKQIAPTSTPAPKAKPGTKSSLKEELNDLESALPVATGSRRQTKKPKVTYKLISDDSESDSEIELDDDESEGYEDDE